MAGGERHHHNGIIIGASSLGARPCRAYIQGTHGRALGTVPGGTSANAAPCHTPFTLNATTPIGIGGGAGSCGRQGTGKKRSQAGLREHHHGETTGDADAPRVQNRRSAGTRRPQIACLGTEPANESRSVKPYRADPGACRDKGVGARRCRVANLLRRRKPNVATDHVAGFKLRGLGRNRERSWVSRALSWRVRAQDVDEMVFVCCDHARRNALRPATRTAGSGGPTSACERTARPY